MRIGAVSLGPPNGPKSSRRWPDSTESTAPIHDLSAIAESPKDLDPEAEARLLDERPRSIEERAAAELASELRENGIVEPVPIPEGFHDTKRGSAPSLEQIAELQRDLHVDAILHGEIPWYGKTKLLYPILGETLDIAAESVILGVATHWYLPLELGNISLREAIAAMAKSLSE